VGRRGSRSAAFFFKGVEQFFESLFGFRGQARIFVYGAGGTFQSSFDTAGGTGQSRGYEQTDETGCG
jgi:hypothetical protein